MGFLALSKQILKSELAQLFVYTPGYNICHDSSTENYLPTVT